MSLHHAESVVAQLPLRLEHDAALVSHLQTVCDPVPRRGDVWLATVLLDECAPSDSTWRIFIQHYKM